VELWARGEYGGEKTDIGVSLTGKDKAHPDSGMTSVRGIVLEQAWQRYEIPLKRIELSSTKTGFAVSIAGRRASSGTIYLDDIRFVR